MQFEGRNCNNTDINPVTDSQEPLRRNSFGSNYAPTSQAPRQKRPEQTHARAIVRECVAAWESQKFKETDHVGVPEAFDIGEDDANHSGDREDWYQKKGERHHPRQLEKPSSKAASSTGGGASQRLDGRKKERDLVIARYKLKKAEREELEAELHVAELDAAVGLERRSRNSSQASSARSNNPSEASGSRRSHRRSTTGKERSLRGSLEEVLKGPEDVAIRHLTIPQRGVA
jgi:hypothetical protein